MAMKQARECAVLEQVLQLPPTATNASTDGQARADYDDDWNVPVSTIK